jgi:hypothetical protein
MHISFNTSFSVLIPSLLRDSSVFELWVTKWVTLSYWAWDEVS